MRSLVLRTLLREVCSCSLFRVALWSLLIWALLFLLFNIFADERRYLQVSAETEALHYRVMRPALATFPVVGGVIQNQSHCDAELEGGDTQDFVGLVRPGFLSTVKYRIAKDKVSVRLEARDMASSDPVVGAGELIVSGKRCQLRGSATVVFDLTEDNRRPLPVAGPTEIGVAFGAPLAPVRGRRAHEGFMHGAEVVVFGRSIMSDRLFPLYDSPISIPAGGTLSTVEFDREPISEEDSYGSSTDWYGVVEMGEGESAGVFLVTATVQTTDLVFTRAGSAGEKETIAVGFLTEVVRDPDLSSFLLWFGLLFFLFQVVALVFSTRSG